MCFSGVTRAEASDSFGEAPESFGVVASPMEAISSDRFSDVQTELESVTLVFSFEVSFFSTVDCEGVALSTLMKSLTCFLASLSAIILLLDSLSSSEFS